MIPQSTPMLKREVWETSLCNYRVKKLNGLRAGNPLARFSFSAVPIRFRNFLFLQENIYMSTQLSAPVRSPEKEFELKVSRAAKGKWHYILKDLAPSMENALDYAPEHVSCPVHGGFDGFRLFSDYNDTGGGVCNSCNKGIGFSNGFSLLAWVKNYSRQDAVKEVNNWLKEGKVNPEKINRPPPIIRPKVDPVKAQQELSAVMDGTTQLKGTLGEEYLMSRGIWIPNQSPILRFHPNLPYYHKVNKDDKRSTFFGNFPAIITPIRNSSGKLVSIHRTFISVDGKGKAPVPDAKKLMSGTEPLGGASARLFYPEHANPELRGVLGAAEGLETSLAAKAVSTMPVWMGVSATLMQQMYIPEWVELLVIWADLDTSKRGEEAANMLADKAEKQGVKVELYLPNFKLTSDVTTFDWNDVLVEQGLSGFPAKWRRWRPS